MNTNIIKTASAIALALTMSTNAQAFSIDLGPVNGGVGPGFADPSADGDRIFSSTTPTTGIQLNIPVNTITVSNFNFGASIGDTFNFTDVGTGNFTTALPTPAAGFDGEGYNQLGGFELLGDFILGGTATVTSISATAVDFDFVFSPGGTLELFYDETVNGVLNVATSESVLLASVTSGGGSADQTVGSATQDAGSFVLDLLVDDLLDGFWLQDDGSAFVDGISVSFVDGNINETVASFAPIDALGNGTLTIAATSDGSFRLETAAVPEPSSLVLIGLGLLGVNRMTRRKAM